MFYRNARLCDVRYVLFESNARFYGRERCEKSKVARSKNPGNMREDESWTLLGIF